MQALTFNSGRGFAFKRCAALFVLCGLSSSLFGATTLYRWTGGSPISGDWSVGANWLGGVAPTGGDQRLIFQAGAGHKINTNDLPAGTVFESVWIAEDGYNIYGNAIRSHYLRMEAGAGTSTFRPDIAANADVSMIVDLAASTLVMAGDIALGGDTLTVSGAGDLTIQGVISGTGNFMKSNSGDVRLAGFGANTFSGTSYVTAGILRLSRYTLGVNFTFIGTTAIPGDLVIGSGTGGLVGDIVTLERDNQIANNATVSVFGSGSLELSDQEDIIGALNLTAGSVSTGNGLLTVLSTIYCNAGTKKSIIAGHMDLSTNSPKLIDVASGAQLEISAAVSGPSGTMLTKTNRGELILTGTNTYSGVTRIVGGTLTGTQQSSFGSTSSGTVLEFGALLKLQDTGTAAEALTARGGTMEADGACAWNGSVALERDLPVLTDAGSVLGFSSSVSGTGGFVKNGEGTMRLAGTAANTHIGTNRMFAGTLELYKFFNGQNIVSIPGALIIGDGVGTDVVRYGGPGQIADTSSVTITESGVLQMGSWNDRIGSLSGSGEVTMGNATLTVGDDINSTVFHGAINGMGNLVKVGQATLTLGGTNLYGGSTTVSAGTLSVNGVLSASPVTVQSGAILGGTGTVASVAIGSGGTLSPGNSPGILKVGGSVTFSGGNYFVELNGTSSGTQYDQLTSGAAPNLGHPALNVSLGFAPPLSNSFVIIRNNSAGPVSGAFAGLSQGAIFPVGAYAFQINYNGGDGNDVTIMRIAAPASQFASIGCLPDGTKQLFGQGLPGLQYVLQATTNLNSPIVWEPIGTNTANASGMYSFIDKDVALYRARFYRTVSP